MPEQLHIGLFYEMMHYLFGVFPEIYDFHANMVSDPRNELKMEIFHSDFDRNINVILERLNLLDSADNRHLLARNGLVGVDIMSERKRLYALLKTQDSSLVEVTNNEIDSKDGPLTIKIPKNIHKVGNDFPVEDRRALMSEFSAGHIHRGRNNTHYIYMLLSIDPNICLLLKHITNIIDYDWAYSNYC